MTRPENAHGELPSSDRAVERLTALWALSEAGMGGLIHAMKIPFTGIVVGSTAVILISTIGYFAKQKASAVFRATMVVLLIKAAASPHTPIPAYVAVAFQGLAGALLFGWLPSRKLASMILGLLALWQGAAQKLIVMTLLYGRPLWEGVDAVGRWMLDHIGSGPVGLSPTGWFLTLYMGYYTAGGLITGWLAATLPPEIARSLRRAPVAAPSKSPESPDPIPVLSKPWWKRVPFKAGLITLALCGALIFLAPASEGVRRAFYVTIRATVIIGIWMLAVRPLTTRALRAFQRREQSRYGTEVARAMDQLPALRRSAAAVWTNGGHRRGLRRWKHFFVEWVAGALREGNTK